MKRDLTLDNTIYNITYDNFDFGIYMDYTLKDQEPEVWENLDQYVDLRLTQNNYRWIKDEKGNPVFKKDKIRTYSVNLMLKNKFVSSN